jgi:hypothetical protein
MYVGCSGSTATGCPSKNICPSASDGLNEPPPPAIDASPSVFIFWVEYASPDPPAPADELPWAELDYRYNNNNSNIY